MPDHLTINLDSCSYSFFNSYSVFIMTTYLVIFTSCCDILFQVPLKTGLAKSSETSLLSDRLFQPMETFLGE